jgi:hypothetical protein
MKRFLIVAALSLLATPAAAPLIPKKADVAAFIADIEGLRSYRELSANEKELAVRGAAAFFAAWYCRLPDKERVTNQYWGRAIRSERSNLFHPFEEARLAITGLFLEEAFGHQRTKASCGVAAQITGMPVDSLPD